MARGYRDELAALRARKEALESEVAELREREEELSAKEKELEEAHERIERLEAEVDALEDERDESDSAGREDARQAAGRENARAGQAWLAIIGASTLLLSALGAFFYVGVSRPPPSSTFRPPGERVEREGLPACTLESTPAGVAVYGGIDAFIVNGGDLSSTDLDERFLLGRTPTVLARAAAYEVELEKPGFAPVKLTIPELDPENIDGSCSLRTTLAKTAP